MLMIDGVTRPPPTGCSLIYTQFAAQLGGVSLYTFNTFDENNFAINENCLGQAFLVGGKCMYVCVCSLRAASPHCTYAWTRRDPTQRLPRHTHSTHTTTTGGVDIDKVPRQVSVSDSRRDASLSPCVRSILT